MISLIRNTIAPQTYSRAFISTKITTSYLISNSTVSAKELMSRRWTSYVHFSKREWKKKPHSFQTNALAQMAVSTISRPQTNVILFRRFSKSSTLSKLELFKKFFKDPRTIKYGSIFLGTALAAALYYELYPSTAFKITIEDPPIIEELKKFVQKFNDSKNLSIEEQEALYEKALEHISYYRSLGNLSPRRPSHPDAGLATIGLLTLTECDDFAIRNEAFKYLKIILRKAFDPSESISKLLILEYRIGEKLKKSSEVSDSITCLHEQVACYNLVLEKIFLSTLQMGSFLSKDSKQDISLRARAISKRLAKNPAFQYEAHNAKLLSDQLETPSQKVTETMRAILDFEALYLKTNAELSFVLLECLTVHQGLERLKEFISKAPGQFEKAEHIFLRLKENWEEKNVDLYATILLSKPHWKSSVTVDSMQILQNLLKTAPRGEKNWLMLYRLIEVYSEIVFSKAQDPVRQQAFEAISSMICIDTPWQVRYKVAAILLQLKNDLLFQDVADEHWKKHQSIPVSNLSLTHSLSLFASIQEKIKEAEQILEAHRHHGLKGKLKDKVDSVQDETLIPRKAFLDALAIQFHNYDVHVAVQIIYGMRGAGKTTLAIDYATRFSQDYNYIHWIDAKTFDNDLEQLAHHAGIKSETIKSMQEKQLLLKKWLEERQNAGWLIIIDNVDPEDCEKVKSFLPYSGGHVLITTYHNKIKDQFSSPISFELPLFSELEATHYLLQKTQYSIEDKQNAKQICAELGYLPLPLSHARAYIKNLGCSLSHFLKFYHAHKTKILSGVATTWDMNFAAVEKISPLASELLAFLAQLYPHAIPYNIIQTWLSMSQPNKSEPEIHGALMILKEFALIGGANSIYNIHSFLHEVIKNRFNHKAQKLLALEVISKIVKSLDTDNPKNWSEMNVLIPHCNWVIEENSSTDGLKLCMQIRIAMSKYYNKLGYVSDARSVSEKGLKEARAYHKTDLHSDVADSLHQLGVVFEFEGDIAKAKEYHENALAIRRAIYKTDEHEDVASSLFELGVVLTKLGKFENAKDSLELSLTIAKKVYKTEEHRAVALCLHQLGTVLEQMADYEGAKTYYEHSLAIKRKLYKTDEHPAIASAFHQIGVILEFQGNLMEAKSYYEKSLEIERKIRKTDVHSHIAASIHQIGMVFFELGNYEEALVNFKKSLEIEKAIHKSDDHPDEGASYYWIGKVAQENDDLKEAEDNYRKCLAIAKKTYVDQQPDIAYSYKQLGAVLALRGKLVEAQEHIDEALMIARKVYKTDVHPSIADIRFESGKILQSQGNFEAAKKVYEEVFEIRKQFYKKDDHPDMALSLFQLGLLYQQMGDLSQAKTYLDRTLAAQRKIYKNNDEHPKIKKTLAAILILKK